MDHRNLFGIAAIILSAAVFVHSLNSANAFPQGPNVSTGSNPIEHYSHINCNNTQSTLFTNNTSQPFIITDVIVGERSVNAHLYIDGVEVYRRNGNNNGSHTTHLISGIKVTPGETVQCINSNYFRSI